MNFERYDEAKHGPVRVVGNHWRELINAAMEAPIVVTVEPGKKHITQSNLHSFGREYAPGWKFKTRSLDDTHLYVSAVRL